MSTHSLISLKQCDTSPERGPWITLLTIDECGSKFTKNNVLDCHYATNGNQKQKFIKHYGYYVIVNALQCKYQINSCPADLDISHL